MMLLSRIFFYLLLALAWPAQAADNVVSASLVSESSSVAPGKALRLGVLLEAPPGWHTYHKNPGDAGLPTTLAWQLPDGFSAGEIDWPAPEAFKEGTLTTYGYKGTTLLPVTLQVPAALPEAAYNIAVKVDWLVCKEICIPESKELTLELPVGAGEASIHAALFTQEKPAQPMPDLWPVVLLALLGGMVLNLMPCVLPILSLKALAIINKTGRNWAHTIRHGIAYTLGVLLSFAALAAVLISLQHAGEAVGWGYHMQSPGFVTFLVILLFLIGLNLSGLLHVPVLLGGVNIQQHSIMGSFLTGILATLVAAPCTAPFMASAVGVALTLPAWAAMAVFLSLGFGLALPFLLISIFPGLLRILPKPGAWMERFKQFLAFPMYASVIWLLWVLGMQVGMGGVALALCALLGIVFLLWLKVSHGLRLLAALAIALLALYASMVETAPMQHTPYSKDALAQLREKGKAVYVDATAAWCITCQVNKKLVLENVAIRELFEQRGITLMIADWTNRDAEITEFLAGFGYNGVPLNVYYPPHGEPVVLPQILTESSIIDAVSR